MALNREALRTHLTAALHCLRQVNVDLTWPNHGNVDALDYEEQRHGASTWTDFMLDGWEAPLDDLRLIEDDATLIAMLQARFRIMARDIEVWQADKEPLEARRAMANATIHFIKAQNLLSG